MLTGGLYRRGSGVVGGVAVLRGGAWSCPECGRFSGAGSVERKKSHKPRPPALLSVVVLAQVNYPYPKLCRNRHHVLFGQSTT